MASVESGWSSGSSRICASSWQAYFTAGRDLLHGQKRIDQGQFADAIPYLQATLKVAPECAEGVLLLGKAYFLAGRPKEGDKLLRPYNFEKNDLSDEVEQIYGRVGRAFQRAEQADKLYKEKKWEEAAKAMHEAAGLYPEFGGFREAVLSYDGNAAFERKDYDAFLRISEEAWKQHPSSPEYAGMVASALACKYAVTGEPDYRSRSEQMLDAARRLAQSSADALAVETEVEARTRYRLQSRQIIGIDEYNQRFPVKQGSH
jgi:tetratricopeptide (TPR) repeat protein